MQKQTIAGLDPCCYGEVLKKANQWFAAAQTYFLLQFLLTSTVLRQLLCFLAVAVVVFLFYSDACLDN